MTEECTTHLEHENLAVHVEKCELRYQGINARLKKIETTLNSIDTSVKTGYSSVNKVLITSAGTVIAGLLSTIIVMLITRGG